MNNILKTYKIIYNQIIKRISENSAFILPLISGFLLVLIIRSVLAILDTIFIQDEFPLQRIIFFVSTGLLVQGLEIGYTKFVFEIIDKKNRSIFFIFNQFHILGQYLVGLIICYLLIILICAPGILYILYKYGFQFFDALSSAVFDPYFQELASSYFNFTELLFILLLFSVPSIYIMIRVFFWAYFVIDKNTTSINAIKSSWVLTRNKNMEIIIFGLGLLIFNFLGALMIIGICVTIPISYLFICLYFRHLLKS